MRVIRMGKSRMKRADDSHRPYRELSLIYDELVGDTAFECWKDNFEGLASRHGINFETAADVACGTGHAAGYLAGSCTTVYAVDASPEMLEVARSKMRAKNIVFLEQSFTELELPEPVDLLTCNFDSLNYLLREEDLQDALVRFARNLRMGGYCVFDMNTTRELEVEWGTAAFVHRVSRGMAVWESEWDPDSRTNTLRMTNFIRLRNGLYSLSEETHRERSYDTDFVLGLVFRAGFTWAEARDARDMTGVGEETRRVQFVARR